ncbi:MAG: hypothetical protein AAF633_27190, partial [Chloroflexota bacterium]
GTVNETPQAKALAEFKHRWLDGHLSSNVDTLPDESVEKIALSGKKRRFRMIAYAAEPILVSHKSEAGNVYNSRQIVPGTTIMGALANRAAHHLNINRKGIEAPPLFVQTFLRGGISTSGLLPLAADTDTNRLMPTVPSPLVFNECQVFESRHNQLNMLYEQPNILSKGCPHLDDPNVPEKNCGNKMKTLKKPFVILKDQPGSDPIKTHKPKRVEEMHIQIERATGRANDGDLYEYVALEAGQWFQGELDLDQALWDTFQEWIAIEEAPPLGDGSYTFSIRLGKASKRGYGLSHLILTEISDENATSIWSHTPAAQRFAASAETQALTMLFITDGIVVDRWHRFYRSFDKVWLAELLDIDPSTIECKGIKQRSKSSSVDSFNNHRRMPRWRDEVILAGSAAFIKFKEIDLEKLAPKLLALEQNGIGLRTHEGFGRVVFNHPILAQSRPQLADRLMISLTDARLDAIGQLAKRQPHALQAVDEILDEWSKALAQPNQFNNVDHHFEGVARLLYLKRFDGIDALKAWLALDDKTAEPAQLNRSENLWGAANKRLLGRDGGPKLNGQGLKKLTSLLDDLETRTDQLSVHNKEIAFSQGIVLLTDAMTNYILTDKGEPA